MEMNSNQMITKCNQLENYKLKQKEYSDKNREEKLRQL